MRKSQRARTGDWRADVDLSDGEIVIDRCGLADGPWHECTSNYDCEAKDGAICDQLGPSEVKVFVKR
jgi:hypothetical protein